MNHDLSVIVLAAGKGTRMKSEKAKVLHEVFYAPMLEHVLNSVNALNSKKTVVVVGHQQDKVKNRLASYDVTFAEQTIQLGTGHAVLAAEDALTDISGTVMILCGDTPLIRASMLSDLLEHHQRHSAQLTLLTTKLDNPANYGRIISDGSGNIRGIVEHKDANEEQLLIQEINAGIYCVNKEFLFSSLKKVGTNNSQGEVYLTDIVKLAVDDDFIVKTFVTRDSLDVLGVNSRLELSQAQTALQLRRNEELMASGVSMINPETIRISYDSIIMSDCIIEPCVHIHGASNIGHTTVIEQGAVLKKCLIGEGAIIGAHSYLVNTTVSKGQIIPPNTTIL